MQYMFSPVFFPSSGITKKKTFVSDLIAGVIVGVMALARARELLDAS